MTNGRGGGGGNCYKKYQGDLAVKTMIGDGECLDDWDNTGKCTVHSWLPAHMEQYNAYKSFKVNLNAIAYAARNLKDYIYKRDMKKDQHEMYTDRYNYMHNDGDVYSVRKLMELFRKCEGEYIYGAERMKRLDDAFMRGRRLCSCYRAWSSGIQPRRAFSDEFQALTDEYAASCYWVTFAYDFETAVKVTMKKCPGVEADFDVYARDSTAEYPFTAEFLKDVS